MKKLLFILIVGLVSCNCKRNTPSQQLNITSEYPKPFSLDGHSKSMNIALGCDGHEYIQHVHGNYFVIHSPECKLCQSRNSLVAPLASTPQVIHDTVFSVKKDIPAQKRVKLICINSSDIVQQGRLHTGTTNLVVGDTYTTIAPPYLDNGDSVYLIENVGPKLIHRFIKPY